MYLYDIIQAAHALHEFSAGKTFADYEQSALLRSAVERQFEIIGEALNQALHESPDLSQRIGNPRQIVGFRNRLIPGYRLTQNDIVWHALEAELPRLCHEVETLLRELDPDYDQR